MSADPIWEKYLGTNPNDLPNAGMFLTKNMNVYNYTAQNPINYNDPDGNIVNFIIKGAADFAINVTLGVIENGGKLDSGVLKQAALDTAVDAVNPAAAYSKVKKIAKVVKASKKAKKTKKSWNGPADYSDIVDSKHVGSGKKYTQAQKKKIRERNREHNDGVLRSDQDGSILDEPVQSKKGVRANMNQAEVDHIDARANGGSNSHKNAQLLSKKQNLEKSNN